jgi:translation initiation factor eIF-2B subunit epsilon
MSNSGLSKEATRQALLVAEDLAGEFLPLADLQSHPIALQPLGDRTLIEHTLQLLRNGGVQQVLVCCSQVPRVREHLLANDWFRPAIGAGDTPFVHLFPAEGLSSLGDVMREVFASQQLKQNDFILVDGFVVGQLPLAQLLQQHIRQRVDGDKGCALTLLMRHLDSAHPAHQFEPRPLLVVNRTSGKLLHFEPAVGNSSSVNIRSESAKSRSFGHVRLPLERLRASTQLQIRADLHEIGVAICSPAVPALFADNFDYGTRDELMHGLLVHEELLGNSLYVQSVADRQLIGRVHNWRSYERIASDLMRGWTHKTSRNSRVEAIDRVRPSLRIGIWQSDTAHVQPDVRLSGHVMLGPNCQIENAVELRNCMLIAGCSVGSKSVLNGTVAFQNVRIASGCRLSRCMLGAGVEILEGCQIAEGCLLAAGVKIGPNVSLPAGTRLTTDAFDKDEPIDRNLVGERGNAYRLSANDSVDESDLSDEEDADGDDKSEVENRTNEQLWALEQPEGDVWKCDYESEDSVDESDDSDQSDQDPDANDAARQSDDGSDDNHAEQDEEMDEDSQSKS